MKALVSDPSRCLLVAQPFETDDDLTKKVIEDNLSMIADLVTLEFLKDSTEDYKETLAKIVASAQADDGLTPRGYLVYTATTVGQNMFAYSKKSIN